jgi:large subunit ribosomal protein L22
LGRLDYSLTVEKERFSKAMSTELHVSPKHALDICRAIKGMRVADARRFLEEVIALKRPVPFKRHNKKIPHRRGLVGWDAGRYPQKAAREVLHLLNDAANNAEYKGLDPEDMRIYHAATKKGRTIRGWMPRAMGRATPKNTETVSIEMILTEVS